jgi:hypothetical protein
MHEPVVVHAYGSQALQATLLRHPFVELELFAESEEVRLTFRRGGWLRTVCSGSPTVKGPYGLPELIDNNPLVCADEASCPGPAATLASIAAGPLARAGLLMEAPAFLFSFDGDYHEVEAALRVEGWEGGATCAVDQRELDGCMACTCLTRIPHGLGEELDGLYGECFGRSFFVREHRGAEWSPSLVSGTPFAVYHLLLSQGEDGSMLRVDVLADADGKCGAAQLVHTMNIMAGFEEDLGIEADRTLGTAGAI